MNDDRNETNGYQEQDSSSPDNISNKYDDNVDRANDELSGQSKPEDIINPVTGEQNSEDNIDIQKKEEEPSADEPVNNPVNTDTSNHTDTGKLYNETQKVWQMHNFQGNNFNNNGFNNNGFNHNPNNINSGYYKESYKNQTRKKSDAWKYVLVSIISSIVGGAFLTVMLLGVAPVVQPQLKNLLGEAFPNADQQQDSKSNVGELKKVEIVQSGESAVTSVAEKVGPSVVGIRTTYQSTNELFGAQSDGGEGSGIIISADGYILTNHHVIENALNDKTRSIRSGSKIEVFLPNKIDKPYTATVKGYDSKADLAVLKINETNLPAIEFGDSDSLKIGEAAIAFGNPGGLEYMGSVTSGVISGLNRTVQLDGGRKIRLVQTDAAINPGNSGGALVNIKGQLIGVNTIKMVATGFEGLGFAIPVNDAKKIADELIKNTYVAKPYLGISVDQRYTEEIAKANNLPMGVYVAEVELLGAAQKAGIKADDIILKFNKVAVKSYDDLEEEKNKHKPGDVIEVQLYRDGKEMTLKVTLGETK